MNAEDSKYKDLLKVYIFCIIVLALMMVAWSDLTKTFSNIDRPTSHYVFCWMTLSSILYCVMTNRVKTFIKNYTISVGIMTEIYIACYLVTGELLNLWDPSKTDPIIEYGIVFSTVLAMEPIIVDDVARKLK